MKNHDERALAAAALSAMENAYAPYSGFKVGAALLCSDGRVFTGANVENSSFGATICAERTACASAVAAGARSFCAIAVATKADPPAPPCGICRQVLAEFGGELEVILVNSGGKKVKTSIKTLLPSAFSLRG
jgi:cytidine deaminase